MYEYYYYVNFSNIIMISDWCCIWRYVTEADTLNAEQI